MFERYTEKQCVPSSLGYEASQFGSPSIELEYLLLSLLRENESLANMFRMGLFCRSANRSKDRQ
jgi:hypothetical protein